MHHRVGRAYSWRAISVRHFWFSKETGDGNPFCAFRQEATKDFELLIVNINLMLKAKSTELRHPRHRESLLP